MTVEPVLEIEQTWDADGDIAVPDWRELPGVDSVDAPERRDLDARYFDTADTALARVAVALRRREGGPDAGWHVKATTGEGRLEWHFPLTALTDDRAPDLPPELLEALAPWSSGSFEPLARVRNSRTAYALRDTAGAVVAEFVDDRVDALAERTGIRTQWREWELELGPGAPADTAGFFAAADTIARKAGARPPSADSKLARALGA